MLIVILVFKNQSEDEYAEGDEDDWKNKIANGSRWLGLVRVLIFDFIFPLPPRRAALKELGGGGQFREDCRDLRQ